MSNELLMFPEFVQSVKAFFRESPQAPLTGFAAAVKGGLFSCTEKAAGNVCTLSINNLAEAQRSGREIGMLEIRCDYLQQLGAMRQAEGTNLKQVELGIISAGAIPIPITFTYLRQSAEEELRVILSRESSLKSLFSDRLLADYGLLNMVSVKLQNPLASMLFTHRQIQAMGKTLRAGSSPICLFTPVVQTFFRRGGKMVPTREAAATEQLSIASNKLAVEQRVRYAFNQYYDIGELRLTEAQRNTLLHTAYGSAAEYDHLCRFASCLQNEAGVPLSVRETSMQGLPAKSLYSIADNAILLGNGLHPAQKQEELITRLSEAVITMTSPSPLHLQSFERQLLSLQLHTKWSATPGRAAFHEICGAFEMAEQQDDSVSLERVTARVSQAARYIYAGVEEAAQQQDKQQTHQPEQEYSLQEQPSASGGLLENFLRGT